MENSRQVTYADMKKDESCESTKSSIASSSSLSADLADDAISSSSSATSSPSHGGGGGGPLYQLADLMAQLPIKRGLSKYYDGKSESFGSLVSVRSVEDLRKRMKSCNLNRHKFSAKATIAKRSPKRSLTFSPKASNSMAAVHWF